MMKIKTQSKTDAEPIHEMNEINQQFELLNDRLNALLGKTLISNN